MKYKFIHTHEEDLLKKLIKSVGAGKASLYTLGIPRLNNHLINRHKGNTVVVCQPRDFILDLSPVYIYYNRKPIDSIKPLIESILVEKELTIHELIDKVNKYNKSINLSEEDIYDVTIQESIDNKVKLTLVARPESYRYFGRTTILLSTVKDIKQVSLIPKLIDKFMKLILHPSVVDKAKTVKLIPRVIDTKFTLRLIPKIIPNVASVTLIPNVLPSSKISSVRLIPAVQSTKIVSVRLIPKVGSSIKSVVLKAEKVKIP